MPRDTGVKPKTRSQVKKSAKAERKRAGKKSANFSARAAGAKKAQVKRAKKAIAVVRKAKPATAPIRSAKASKKTPVAPTPKAKPVNAVPGTLPTPKLKVDSGVIKPVAGSAGSTKLAVEPKKFSPWIGVVPLGLLLSGLVLWDRRRRRRQDTAPPVLQDPIFSLDPGDVATSSAIIRADLLRNAEPFYRDLRLASSRKDHEFFHQHCTEDLATSMILDSETTAQDSAPQVDGLRAELVDLFEEVNRYVASVQYTAQVQSGDAHPRKVKEVWHFVREPDAPFWRLAAVESS